MHSWHIHRKENFFNTVEFLAHPQSLMLAPCWTTGQKVECAANNFCCRLVSCHRDASIIWKRKGELLLHIIDYTAQYTFARQLKKTTFQPLPVSVSHPSLKVGIKALILCLLFRKCPRRQNRHQVRESDFKGPYLKYSFIKRNVVLERPDHCHGIIWWYWPFILGKTEK